MGSGEVLAVDRLRHALTPIWRYRGDTAAASPADTAATSNDAALQVLATEVSALRRQLEALTERLTRAPRPEFGRAYLRLLPVRGSTRGLQAAGSGALLRLVSPYGWGRGA